MCSCHLGVPRLGDGSKFGPHDFGVLQTSPPDSVTERDTFTRRLSASKYWTRSAAVSPHLRPVYERNRTTSACRSTAAARAATCLWLR
jgi:hypothetical protein